MQARSRGAWWHDSRREQAPRPAIHLHVPAGASAGGAELVSGRVLVIDDEVEMQRALRAGLSYHDFDVHAGGSGEEAIREAASRRAEVILRDLGLPGMYGL